jgi:divalent metal cation (Fe/Co/Zn/Cd) transporter
MTPTVSRAAGRSASPAANGPAAAVIWASAAFAGYESIRKLIGHGPTTHIGAGMAGAVIGIAGNLAVARYKLVVGKRIHSATLIADARHSWLDALSSTGALAG